MCARLQIFVIHYAITYSSVMLFSFSQADEVAAKEFKSKYGFAKGPSTMAQRKISATVSEQVVYPFITGSVCGGV